MSLSPLVELVEATAVGFVLEKKDIMGGMGLAAWPKSKQGTSEFGSKANVATKYTSARVATLSFTH